MQTGDALTLTPSQREREQERVEPLPFFQGYRQQDLAGPLMV
jgi:hypothetical protein